VGTRTAGLTVGLRAARPDGEVERETGLEPATFCLGSPELVSAVA
jgi:hypothetical protein